MFESVDQPVLLNFEAGFSPGADGQMLQLLLEVCGLGYGPAPTAVPGRITGSLITAWTGAGMRHGSSVSRFVFADLCTPPRIAPRHRPLVCSKAWRLVSDLCSADLLNVKSLVPAGSLTATRAFPRIGKLLLFPRSLARIDEV